MYGLKINEKLRQRLHKMRKRQRGLLRAIDKKVLEIQEDPHRFKPLSNVMRGLRRVHINKSFVLVFSIDEASKTVFLEDFDHHDRIYRN